MRISFDLDDVLASFQLGWIEFNNSKYGTTLTFNDIYSYNYMEVMGLEKDEVLKRIFEFYETNTFANLVPVKGSIEIVTDLAKEHELVVLTSRPEEILDLTRYWIKTNYDDAFLDVLTSAQVQRDGYDKGKITKADICREYSIDIHIEDAPTYAKDTSEAGIQTIIIDKPWNIKSEFKHEKLERVKSITDIPGILA